MHLKACHYKQCSAVAKILYVMLKVSFEIMQVNYSTIHFHCNITFLDLICVLVLSCWLTLSVLILAQHWDIKTGCCMFHGTVPG